MAKINNKDIYTLEDLPSLLDYLIGSKGINGKTKNFSLDSIFKLMNGIYGKSSIQFEFSDGTDEDINYYTTGHFFTNTNETDINNYTQLIFNKESLYPIDLSLLFNKIATLDNVIIKLENRENPNNFSTFEITSFENNIEYFVLGTKQLNDFYLGELINKKTYSLLFDVKSTITGYSENKIYASGMQEFPIPQKTEVLAVFLGEGKLLKIDTDWIVLENKLKIFYPLEESDEIYITGITH